MFAYYCLSPTNPANFGSSPSYGARATALGLANVMVGDPTGGLVTAWPSAVVVGSETAPVIIADDQGQATAAAVTAAMTAATTAEATAATNQATITADIKSRQATIQTWMAANPNGAVLTGPQTLVLAEMLNGLCDVLLGLVSSTAGT